MSAGIIVDDGEIHSVVCGIQVRVGAPTSFSVTVGVVVGVIVGQGHHEVAQVVCYWSIGAVPAGLLLRE